MTEQEAKSGLLHYLAQAWLVLALAVCFGTALAAVEKFTRPKIEQNIKDFIAAKLVDIFGEGTTTAEPVELAVKVNRRDRKVKCYPAIQDGKRIGWGVQAEGKGYDTLLLVVGVDNDVKKLIGYRVVTSLETEGIGDVIELNDAKPESVKFVRQFEGKDAAKPLEPVGSDVETAGNQVNTVSSATISSKGVVATINDNLEAVRDPLRALAKGGRDDE